MSKDLVQESIEKFEDYLPEMRQNNFQICFDFKDTGEYYVLRCDRDGGFPENFLFDWNKFDNEGEVEEGEIVEIYEDLIPRKTTELYSVVKEMSKHIADHTITTIPENEVDDKKTLETILVLHFSGFIMDFLLGQDEVEENAEETYEEVLQIVKW